MSNKTLKDCKCAHCQRKTDQINSSSEFWERIISNRNPFKPDNNHLHHIMIKKFNFSATLVLIQLLILLPITFYYLGFVDIVFSIAITLIFYLFILSNFLCQKKL